jgi:coenzyme Q-binding protein COQ10
VKYRSVSRQVPWTAAQMFDLVVDIEHYPEFLPNWRNARILRREGNVLFVSQEIDLGIRRLAFESRAVMDPPRHLRISSSAGPFRQLNIDWRFTPGAAGGCEVTLEVGLDMRSALLEAVSGRLMDLLTRDILRRFRERAARLNGG